MKPSVAPIDATITKIPTLTNTRDPVASLKMPIMTAAETGTNFKMSRCIARAISTFMNGWPPITKLALPKVSRAASLIAEINLARELSSPSQVLQVHCDKGDLAVVRD